MASSNLGYPYDPELFLLQWQNTPDPTLSAMVSSSAVQKNSTIATLISNGSDLYTVPFYDTLSGDADNYDGVSSITMSTPAGFSQTGVVHGRAHSWKSTDFVIDFNSGADPMKQITSQVATYWQKRRQATMLATIRGAFATTDNAGGFLAKWQQHTLNIATTGATVADANKLSAATAAEAIQKAVGDNSGIFSLAWMHSQVALNLATLQLLQYRKYTDATGIERTIAIADYNGITVIVDDGVPVAASATATGSKEYTTYLMGTGAIQTAPAPVKVPVEIGREKLTNGGYDYYVTRLRETVHPNGFSFAVPSSGYTHSPTDTQLGTAANWGIAVDPKSIAMAAIVSNG